MLLRLEPKGAHLRLRLGARDVSVTTEAPCEISSQNLLPAVITAVDPAGPHECFVSLATGPTTVLARLTRDAVDRLGLAHGRAVFALVKSIAFDHA